MDKQLIEKLGRQNLDVRQFADWNEPFAQQEFNLNLQQLKSRLQAELSQAIQSHIIRKQKKLSDLQKSIELILNTKRKTAEIFENKQKPLPQTEIKSPSKEQIVQIQDNPLLHNLQNLVQLINLKNKVDYCLQKLQPIVNAQTTEENNDEGIEVQNNDQD